MLDFTESVFFRISRPLGTANAPVCEVLRQEANEELSYFHGPVFGGGAFWTAYFSELGAAYTKFGEEIGPSSALPKKHLLDFRFLASFQNQIALSWTEGGSKIHAKFRKFYPCKTVKVEEEVCEMYESRYEAQRKPNLWYTFGERAAAQAESFNIFSGPNFRGGGQKAQFLKDGRSN